MNTDRILAALVVIYSVLSMNPAHSEPAHGVSMYGKPALDVGFSSLPYVNPDAPKGGRIVFGEAGGFDSLNPYILKGRAPWGVRAHVFESLLGRNWDEPFALYGLLAQTVEMGPNREWVEFHLRPEAAFSDGSPVTIDDVIWSYETLAEKGKPNFARSWSKVGKVDRVGERGVRFTFNTVDNELPLILGLRPIMKKSDWDGRDFAASSLDIPTGSSAYIVGKFEPNRFIEFDRNPDYWGRDLGFNRGRNNVDVIRYDFFADGDVAFEAFKAGETSVSRESDLQKWDSEYGFPAVERGDVVKSVIPNSRPSGMEGFVFNTRNPLFADWRVRDALLHAFNFEFVNTTFNQGKLPRRESYFYNSVLGRIPGPATGRVKELLEPFAEDLLPGVLEGYQLPVADGTERNRGNLRKATRLLREAGWEIDDGVLKNAEGKAFEFEIMVRNTSGRDEALANIYAEMLKRLGISMRITLIDSAQYNARRSEYDFDMIINRWGLSLSPGNEQNFYWGSKGVTQPGTRNYMGMNSPAAEAMIEAMLTADNQDDFISAVRALDRILIAGRYVVPIWFSRVSYLAHKSELHFPQNLPIYGDWIGFLPDVWWVEE